MTASGRSHDRIEELVAERALHALDEADLRVLEAEMAEHGRDCPECASLTAEYTQVASALGLSLDPVPLSTAAEERLMRAARQERVAPEWVAEQGVDRTAPSSAEWKGRRAAFGLRRQAGRRWAAGIAAAAIAVLVGVFAVGYLTGSRKSDAESRFVAFISKPGTLVIPFPSMDGAQLAVAVRPGERTGWVVGSAIGRLPEGMVYELWFQRSGSDRMEPAATFVPDDGIVLAPGVFRGSVQRFAVTVERGFQRDPTSDPILVTTVE